MILVQSPFDFYAERDGSPLDAGFLYFGTPNLDPVTNPVATWWDEAGTVPAAQPIRTAGGYSVNGSTPANVYVAGAYSMSIVDRHGQLVAYMPSVTAAIVSATTVNATTVNATTGNFSGNVTAGNFITSGTVEAGYVHSTSNLQANGTVTAGTLVSAGNINAAGDFHADAGTIYVRYAELGLVGSANSPFVDFHSGATTAAYDSRIIATGGTGTVGAGALQYLAAAGHTFTGDVTINGINMNAHKSIAASGYQRFPGGMIIQWGFVSVPGGGLAVSFPMAFPGALLTIAALPNDTVATNCSIQSQGLSGFTLNRWLTGTGAAYGGVAYWLAIGY